MGVVFWRGRRQNRLVFTTEEKGLFAAAWLQLFATCSQLVVLTRGDISVVALSG